MKLVAAALCASSAFAAKTRLGFLNLGLDNENAGPIAQLAAMDAVSDECAGCEDAPAATYACKDGDDQCESSVCGHMPIHVEDCTGPGPCEMARVECSLAHGYYPDPENCQGYCFCSGEVDDGTGIAVPSRWHHCPEGTFYDSGCDGYHRDLATGLGHDGGCCAHPRDIKSQVLPCPGFCPLLSKYHCDASNVCSWDAGCNCCLGDDDGFVPPVTAITPEDHGCNVPLDMVFLIDGSKSVGEERFEKSKSFFKEVVRRMNAATQVAAVTYSEDVNLEFPFTADYNQINSEIDAMSYPSRTTRTGKAIKFVVDEVIPTRRSGVQTVVVVLTDGVSYDRPSDKIKDRAPELHATGAEVYAIGVGDANPEQLDLIASKGDLAIFAQKTDWESLHDPKFVNRLAGNICLKKKK